MAFQHLWTSGRFFICLALVSVCVFCEELHCLRVHCGCDLLSLFLVAQGIGTETCMMHEGEWTAVGAPSWSVDCVSLLHLSSQLCKHLVIAEYVS